MQSDDTAVVNGFRFQTAILRDTDSRTVIQPHTWTATVCYAQFFTSPYFIETYAKRVTYRLKAVDACLLS